jgi:hypothetical protein
MMLSGVPCSYVPVLEKLLKICYLPLVLAFLFLVIRNEFEVPHNLGLLLFGLSNQRSNLFLLVLMLPCVFFQSILQFIGLPHHFLLHFQNLL